MWEHLPLDYPHKVHHCAIPSKLTLAEDQLIIELDSSAYVEDLVFYFAEGNKSSSHFPDSAFISASLEIDGDQRQKIARLHFVGVCDSYTLKVGAQVHRRIAVTHVTYPQHPTVELQGLRVNVFGFTKAGGK